MSMRIRMLICTSSTSVRIDRDTHEELKRLARDLGTTVGEAVAIAARRLRQQRIGLGKDSAAQCQHIRSVSVDRVETIRGNVGPTTLSETREVLALILDIS